MPIPCPIHMPRAWVIWVRGKYPNGGHERSAEIARMCCPNCKEGEGLEKRSNG